MNEKKDFASCQALLERAKQMTLDFPPFVHGMGPAAQYWETQPVKRPSADFAKDFIRLLQDTKIGFLTILSDAPKNIEEVLNGLQSISTLYRHVKIHPAKETELRSKIRKLVYYSKMHGIPKNEMVSSIENKVNIELGTGDLEYIIYKAEIRRIVGELLAETKSFTGKDYCTVLSRLFIEISIKQVISLDLRKSGDIKEIIAIGDSEEVAYLEAQRQLPDGAVVQDRIILQEIHKFNEEFSAYSEKDVRKMLLERISKDANISEISCFTPSRKGLFGIGKRKGRYKTQWIEPYKVSIKYIEPFEIRVRYIP